MKSMGWIVIGFVAGVAVSSLAFAALPRFGDLPSASAPVPRAPDASVQEASVQTDPVVLTTDERTVPDALTGDPLGELDVVARIAIMRWMAANPQY